MQRYAADKKRPSAAGEVGDLEAENALLHLGARVGLGRGFPGLAALLVLGRGLIRRRCRRVEVEPRHSKLCQQSGRFGPCVERGQKLAVRDQARQHLPYEVLNLDRARGGEILSRSGEIVTDAACWVVGEASEDVGGEAENGPVVLTENLGPHIENVVLGEEAAAASASRLVDVGDSAAFCVFCVFCS